MRNIDLDLKSKVPIYIQIRDQLKLMIATGEIGAGKQMPPVRDLASGLLINPNTVSKAYQELERDGYIHTRRGMGTFVSEKEGVTPNKSEMGMASDLVRDFVTRLLEMGISADEVRMLVNDTLEKPKG